MCIHEILVIWCEMVHIVLEKRGALWSAWFTQVFIDGSGRQTALY